MREATLTFGSNHHLIGTLLSPATVSDKPAIVFTNAGFVPRTGPNRLWIRLARLLGNHGFPSIRFDFSNIGDSGRPQDSDDAMSRAVSETRLAMDAVQQNTGASKFILLGLCSGTDACIDTAPRDPRVCGAVLLDPFSYSNIRARALVNWRKLKRHLAGGTALTKLLEMARRRLGTEDSSVEVVSSDIWDELRPLPPREVFAESLAHALQAERRILIVYTGFASETHNYRGQLKHVHPELRKFDRINVALLPHADHTYTNLFMQEQLATTLLQWLTDNFGAHTEQPNPAWDRKNND